MRSDTVKKGIERAGHRSLLRAAGLKDEDFLNSPVETCSSSVAASSSDRAWISASRRMPELLRRE